MPRPRNPARDAAIIAAHASGLSMRQIAAEMRCSTNGVLRALRHEAAQMEDQEEPYDDDIQAGSERHCLELTRAGVWFGDVVEERRAA